MTVLGWVGEKGTRVATLPLENAGILRCAQNDDVKLAKARARARARANQEQGQKQQQQQQQRQKQEQRRNTGISPLRRQSAPPSVEMTFVMGGWKREALGSLRSPGKCGGSSLRSE